MLEARSLTKYYGALPAVRGASFVARPGHVLGYLGPNGSGKSTTVRMLVGLMPPSSGDVLWQGRSILDDLPAFRRVVGYVPEEPHLYSQLTAPEYLRLVGGCAIWTSGRSCIRSNGSSISSDSATINTPR